MTQSSVTHNRKARHNYTILSTLEAGLILEGSEVKSLRRGHASLVDAFAAPDTEGDFVLHNLHIPTYPQAYYFNHTPRRPRKLLLHKREIRKLIGQIKKRGVTLVPLSLYFNVRGKAKIELGLAVGKTKADKRETKKNQEWQREKGRLLKNKEAL